MATHNHLTALSSHTFLEIIAIDPEATPKIAHRWFNLDNSKLQKSLQSEPKLTTWVVQTNDLDSALQNSLSAGIDAGEPVTLTRGDLTWRLALKSDGTLANGGVFPILIEWPQGINPVSRMQDQGVRLKQLILHYPDTRFLENALHAIGADNLVTVVEGDPAIVASMCAGSRNFQLSN